MEGMKLRWENSIIKVAVITGSTSGIGEVTVCLFTTEGAKVVVVGRRKEKGEKVIESIHAQGGEAIFVQTDMTKDEQIEHLVNTTLVTNGINRYSNK